MKRSITALLLLTSIAAARSPDPREMRAALQKAVDFFCEQVAIEGGYLWKYSADLSVREGEKGTGPTTIWVQPPGTPSVGLALLEAWEKTGEASCRAGAIAAARALVSGQLDTGGWNYRIEFTPADRVMWTYRKDDRHSRKARNTSVLDDNNTQAALRLLMQVDQTLDFKDPAIHECTRFALEKLLQAQFSNGAFPQVFDGSVDPASCASRRARIPTAWSRTYEGHQQYWYRPTFNDNVLADVIEVLFEARAIYKDKRYENAALKAGAFILAAQLPEPQAGWAQQYNYEMEPIWARKFEPPSITAGEARGILETLLSLYERTRDPVWLEPIPRALAYYKTCVLPDGRLARFYELGTNKPLYFDRSYTLTYDDSDLPTHYGFIISNWIPSFEKQFERRRGAKLTAKKAPAPLTRSEAERVSEIIAAMDERGAWMENGQLKSRGSRAAEEKIIDCATFNKHIRFLAGAIERTTKP
ncbi:MAG: hypothetical protein ACI97B_000927 [Verrucomicrobiales bacterium]|jgi:hypothetical protein